MDVAHLKAAHKKTESCKEIRLELSKQVGVQS